MKVATQKQKPSSPPKKPDGQLDRITGLIESDFVKKLRARIIGDDGMPIWPAELEVDHEEEDAIRQINLACELLFLRCEGEPLPSKIHPARSLPRIIQELFNEVPNWPDNEPPRVPRRFKEGPKRPDRFNMFRRYEVACAFNIMMKAWDMSQSGGSTGAEWPPQKP